MMDIRLNKLISDAGICSRREADEFIKSGRVLVNNKKPRVGQKITSKDVVKVDGEPVSVVKYIQRQEEQRAKAQEENAQLKKATHRSWGEPGKKALKREHFGKYNKYAAMRKEEKEGDYHKKRLTFDEEQLLREAMTPRFKKSLSRGAIIQRIAANPKSAALRKTSKNNPINKALRAAKRRRND